MKGKHITWVVGIIALLAHHVWFFYGHFGFDDLYYAQLAEQLADGTWDLSDHYSYRIVPLVLWSAVYALFGIHDLSSAIPALLASAGTLSVIYYAFRDRPAWEYVLAVAFFFGMRWNVFYSDKLMPDVFVTLFAALAWLAYYKGQKNGHPVAGVLAAVSLFLAFNSKGTIILLGPLFLFYFVLDLNYHRFQWWYRMIATVVPLLVIYFLVIWGLTGSPFSRFSAITAKHYLNPCSYDSLPWEYLMDRFTVGYYQLLSDAYFLPHLVTAVVAIIVFALRGEKERSHYFYPLTVIVCFLSMNFMTISLTSYNPICLDPRHTMLFSPILAICSVGALRQLLKTFSISTETIVFYIVVGVSVVLLIKPTVEGSLYNRTLNYKQVKPALTEAIASLPRPATVYGSQVMINYGKYYTGFASPKAGGLTFMPLDSLPDCSLIETENSPAYLLRNWYTDWHSGDASTDFENVLPDRGVVLESSTGTNSMVTVERITCP